MHVTLLADSVNRAGVRTSGAVDTLVIDCVSHWIFLLRFDFPFWFSVTVDGEFTPSIRICPADFSHFLQRKPLQFPYPYINLYNAFYAGKLSK
jgi:hypothetical protein